MIYQECKERILELKKDFKISQLDPDSNSENNDPVVLLTNADFMGTENLWASTENLLKQRSINKIIVIINECLWQDIFKKLLKSQNINSDKTITFVDFSQTENYRKFKISFQQNDPFNKNYLQAKENYIKYVSEEIIKIFSK